MRLPSPVIVGRSRERARLVAGVAHPPALVLIEGEAGVGKTRLARELTEQNLLTGHCFHLREPLPFGPVVEALRGLAGKPGAALSPVTGVLRPLLPELAGWLPAPPEPAGEPGTARHRLFRAVLELLSALGRVTVLLEDLHWADEGTIELLRYVTYRMPRGLCLVLTYRREELPDGSALPRLAAHLPPGVTTVELRLDPLPVPAVRDLAGEILGEPGVPAEFAAYLHEHTAGLPFAVEEVLRQLADAREPRGPRPDFAELGVPPALRHSLLDRMDRLGPDARKLVTAAAVLRVPAAEELLGAIAGLDADATAVALIEAVARALLTEQGGNRYGLRHALARQVVYDAQSPPARRRLHRRAAEQLSTMDPQPCVQLAHHWREAGNTTASRRYAERGAEAALAVGDDATAVTLLRQTLSARDMPRATRVRMAVTLSRAAHSGLDNSETIAILRDVLERDRMPRAVRGELRFYLASLLYNQAGTRAAAMAEVARAVPELHDRPALAARAMSTLALPIYLAGEPIADQLGWLGPALDAAARADDPVVRLAVLGNRATALAQVGDAALWRAARELPTGGASPAERYQLARAYQNLANATILIGHYEHARRYLDDLAPLVTEIGSAYLASNAESIRLILDWATGRWDGLAQRARRQAEAHWDVPELSAEAGMVAGRLALAAGDLAGAERMLTDAVDAVPHGTVPVLPVVIAGLARIWMATGRAARAGREVANTIDSIRRKGAWVWVAELAGVGVEALARSGLVAPARELVDDFAAGLAGRDAPLATAALATAEATLSEVEGDPLAAARAFDRACRQYRRITRPFDAALALEGRGRCLLAAGRDGAAELHEAVAAFERLGAPWPASRCRRTLRQYGVSARRGRRGYGLALSPREREVAALAARGRTNREIAAALFLSPRTVEEHVAKALRKLGLSTRAELPELIP